MNKIKAFIFLIHLIIRIQFCTDNYEDALVYQNIRRRRTPPLYNEARANELPFPNIQQPANEEHVVNEILAPIVEQATNGTLEYPANNGMNAASEQLTGNGENNSNKQSTENEENDVAELNGNERNDAASTEPIGNDDATSSSSFVAIEHEHTEVNEQDSAEVIAPPSEPLLNEVLVPACQLINDENENTNDEIDPLSLKCENVAVLNETEEEEAHGEIESLDVFTEDIGDGITMFYNQDSFKPFVLGIELKKNDPLSGNLAFELNVRHYMFEAITVELH